MSQRAEILRRFRGDRDLKPESVTHIAIELGVPIARVESVIRAEMRRLERILGPLLDEPEVRSVARWRGSVIVAGERRK